MIFESHFIYGAKEACYCLIDVGDTIITKTKEMTSYLSFVSSFLYRKIMTRDLAEEIFRSKESLISI
jgi:hypothetical protein